MERDNRFTTLLIGGFCRLRCFISLKAYSTPFNVVLSLFQEGLVVAEGTSRTRPNHGNGFLLAGFAEDSTSGPQSLPLFSSSSLGMTEESRVKMCWLLADGWSDGNQSRLVEKEVGSSLVGTVGGFPPPHFFFSSLASPHPPQQQPLPESESICFRPV